MEEDDDMLSLLVHGLPIEPGFLGRSDVEALKEEAVAFSANGAASSDATLHHFIMALGCDLWLGLKLQLPLTMPPSPSGSAAFNAGILGEMSERIPRHAAFPELESRSVALDALSSLCRALAEGQSEGCVVKRAITAGFYIGGIGKISEDDQVHQAGYLELSKRREANRIRLEKMRISREFKDSALLTFAQEARAHDPFVSKAALERRYRTLLKPGVATRSNNIAKILARFETDGLLSKRATIQCDKPAGKQEI